MHKLAVYIHWPFCKSKCPYCDFNSHVRDRVDQERWRSALLTELDTQAEKIPPRQISSIFFGGGTPSLMPPETAAALIERIRQRWPVTDDIEITLEANPTSVEAGTFAGFKAAGVNRVSLGVQALDDASLAFLGRQHSADEALKAVEHAAQIFDRYSFDLIYARPNQTPADWERELTKALSFARGHLSLYQLTIEENTAFHHAVAKGDFAIPDDEQAEALYRQTEEMMHKAGYVSYEVSNYASLGQESRHNLTYWQGEDYLGIGPGAHGRLTIQDTARVATQTIKSPERWLENVERQGHALEVWQAIDRKDDMAERIMMGLRLKNGIDVRQFREQTGGDIADYINTKTHRLCIEQGLLENMDGRLMPTLAGRLVLNRLTAELLT